MKISIVVPFFNEAASLPELYDQITGMMKKKRYFYELIFIDDGSTDDSGTVVRKIVIKDPKARLISFRRNFGKSAALQAGFRYAAGDYIITMDADLQDDPREIPNFIAQLDAGYDLVCGWKKNRPDPIEKRLPSKLFNRMTSAFSGIGMHDFNCGFKAYRRDVVNLLDIYGERHRYIPVLAHKYGFKITEIPINAHPRAYGKSKYGAERYFRGFFDFLSVNFLTKYIDRPMYFFGTIGFTLFIMGALICVYLSIEWLRGFSIGGRPLFMLGILLLILGTQFFSIGLIADMIVHATFRSDETDSKIKSIFQKNEK